MDSKVEDSRYFRDWKKQEAELSLSGGTKGVGGVIEAHD